MKKSGPAKHPEIFSQIKCQVKPGAKTPGFDFDGVVFQARLKSPPIDGKANEELVTLIAKILDLPKSLVTIKSGTASKTKMLEVPLAKEEVARRINESLSSR